MIGTNSGTRGDDYVTVTRTRGIVYLVAAFIVGAILF